MAGMRRINEIKSKYKQLGFTLLEVVVVMLILAVLAGTVIASLDSGFIEENQETAALFEMTQIRDAIRKFRQDNPTFALDSSTMCTPADASFLFSDMYASSPTTSPCNLDSPRDAWDVNYRLGWRGPYLTSNGSQYVDVGSNLSDVGSGSPISGTVRQDNVAVADPFVSEPVTINSNT